MSQFDRAKTPARSTPDPQDASAPAVPRASEIGDRAGRLGLEIADIAGIVEDLAGLNNHLGQTLENVIDSVDRSTETNNRIRTAMGDLRASADQTRLILSKSSEQVSDTLATAIDNMQALGEGIIGITRSAEQACDTIAKVQEASAAIESISMETQMIAINAGVEAARASDAGRGFAVIAQSIKTLANQVRKFSLENRTNLQALQETLDRMLAVAHHNLEWAQSAIEASNTAKGSTQQIQSLVSSVQQLTRGIEDLGDPVHSNATNSQQVSERVSDLVRVVETAGTQLGKTRERSENILTISEDLMLFIAQAGFETKDSALILTCQKAAAEIKAIFERGLEKGEITQDALFDEQYKPILGTNPQQVMTLFTDYTDRVLPAIQEQVLTSSSRIAFCAAVDRNGYLPTHNLAYSKPQGSDPSWNAANSRNRRIFNDRTGIRAGRNTQPFLLQTYRRDMGGGQHALMKDISAPIIIRGRHWGGFRMGLKP